MSPEAWIALGTVAVTVLLGAGGLVFAAGRWMSSMSGKADSANESLLEIKRLLAEHGKTLGEMALALADHEKRIAALEYTVEDLR